MMNCFASRYKENFPEETENTNGGYLMTPYILI